VIADFLHAFQAESLKMRRSLASWLIIVGAFFTPAIVSLVRLMYPARLPALYAAEDFWLRLWKSSWESMAIFFLPMMTILAASLVTQIEYKNNTWKQVRTLPLTPAVIFFAKLVIVLLMLVQFLALFNVGMYLSGIVPYLLARNVPFPRSPLPWTYFLTQNLRYFIDCLPIVAAQYLLSLRFKNFLVSVGFGFLAWVSALAALSWKLGYVVPYTYSMLNYLKENPGGRAVVPTVDIHWLAVGYFMLFTIGGYWLFATRPQHT
jgi:lantibiotic transport system permease protein